MANSRDAKSGNVGITKKLLPTFYQTPANDKFLQATVDQLFQPGAVKKINGYIGRENAKSATGSDIYLTAPTVNRQNYQLEPSINIQDSLGNTTFFKDYMDYINQIGVFGGNTKNHARLNKQEFYSWDPHIDWDKFVNFQNYYWLPYGPETIVFPGQVKAIESTYTVTIENELSNKEYLFTPNGFTRNPVLKLYRGQTYNFEINSPGNPFSIKTDRSAGTDNRYENDLVSGYGIEQGLLTFTVPLDAPTVLYYQSESDLNLGGVFEILSITEDTYTDVANDLLGKKTYKFADGTQLSNGMKLKFVGNVTPAEYATGEYYVEGVGVAIKLILTTTLEVINNYTTEKTIPFDSDKFDNNPFSDATGFAGSQDYIVINRASNDYNNWSRYNRWFHKDVITASATYNGNVASIDQTARAIRPIIEFEADLKLANSGTTAIADIDIIDTFTKDAFTQIEGAFGYHVDGIPLAQGQRIIFTADTDRLTRNKVFEVQFLDVLHLSSGSRQIHLAEIAEPVLNQVALIKNGLTYQGTSWWYNGTSWVLGQQKTKINQAPLFDVVDENTISYGDTSVYNGSTFVGTTLFSYKIGSGVADTTLGFPLSYRNISNIGDIVFNFTLATDTFQYKESTSLITKNINVGYLVKQTYAGGLTYKNGWQTCSAPNTQAAVRIYKNSGLTTKFNLDIFDDITNLSDLVVKIYVNGIRLSPTLWQLNSGPNYKFITLVNPISKSDVLTIRAFASQIINSKGYYEIPINLQNNPLNNIMGDFTLGEVADHVNSIVDNLGTTFVGSFPGDGNLRDLGNVTQYGTKFVQHSGPLSTTIYHITSETNNIIRSIEQSRDDYNNFKRNFVKTATSLGVDGDPVTLVDLIMQKINKDRPNTAPYYFSDMIPYGASVKTNLSVVDYRIKQYPLSSVFTLTTLSNKAVGIYLNNSQLVHGRDYTFDNQGYFTITNSVVMNNGDTITTVEYDSTDGSFVPATPTKYGMWPAYVPQIYVDNTYATPQTMIQGHDGSKILAYGDYRDQLLLELEKRIFNNIKVQYDPTIFDVADIIPSYNRSNDYSLAEFNQVLAPNFYKWTKLSGRDFTKPLSYDINNPFSYNYSDNYAPDGRQLPGYWRGIFQYLLDTDRPNLCPWEMLGFSQQPSWWVELYGPAPYTGDNLPMWQDINDGMVREPGMPTIKLSKYAKPFLMKHIPVDSNGLLINPIASGLANGTITQNTGNGFVFGDQSPVETAWRRSSHYPFAVVIASILLTPAKTINILLDRSRIARNLAGQLVYTKTNLRISPADILLPSIYSSTTRVQTAGIVNYIVDQILNFIFSNNVQSYKQYITDLATMTAQISYRIGAFTSKEQMNLLLDSKTPASTGNVFVPAENFNVFLNSSSPIRKIVYSGVIITKMPDGYEVKGYSQTQPYFTYYPYVKSGPTTVIGGISAPYVTWTPGETYVTGTIVKYVNSYYRTLSTTVAGTAFDSNIFTPLGHLPVVGGASAVIRTGWDRTKPIVVPYGTEFQTKQEVVDFLLGYGRYLQDEGFTFDSFNVNLGLVTNWETSAKEFLFWTTQNWTPDSSQWKDWMPNAPVTYGTIVRYNGDYYSALYNLSATDSFDKAKYQMLPGISNVGNSVISLSPSASKLTFTTNLAVVDDITNPFYHYEIFKVDGTPLASKFLDSYRSGNIVSYSPRTTDGIYGASFYLIQHEQVITLSNTTIFNDVIYNPESGYRQERLKVSGHVSIDWYGGLDIPGFIFDQAIIQNWKAWTDYALGDIVNYQGFYYSALSALIGTETFDATQWTQLATKPTAKLLPNWSYKASQFEDFYSLDSDNFDNNQQKVAQHLIGYQKRQYLDNILQDDVTEFKFYQGMIREKGTQNSLNKLFNVLSSDNLESLVFYEEWALRLGQYGAAKAFENIEFILNEANFRSNPQGFELRQLKDTSLSETFIIEQTYNDVYLKPLGYNSQPWPLLPVYNSFLREAGYVNATDVFLSLGYLSEISSYDITTFNEGAYVWVAFDGPSWNVYRFTDLQIIINNVSYNNNNFTLTLTTENLTSFQVGDWVGLSQVALLQGFYQITSVNLNSFTISATISGFPQPFTQSNQLVVYALVSQRTSSINSLDSILTVRLNPGELIWTDDQGNGKWATWQYNPVYEISYLNNSAPQNELEFGAVIAINREGNMAAIGTGYGQITTYDKSSPALPWVQRQIIEPPFISTNTVYNVIASTIINSTVVTMSAAASGMLNGVIEGQGISPNSIIISVIQGVSVTISQPANASITTATYIITTNPNQGNVVATAVAIAPDASYMITGSPLAGYAITNYIGNWNQVLVYGPGLIVSEVDLDTGFTNFYRALKVVPANNEPLYDVYGYWETIYYIPVDSYGTWDPTVIYPSGCLVIYKSNVYQSIIKIYGQVTITVTNTAASTYYLTTADTSVLGVGYEIIFSGNTFGGAVAGVIYYVQTIISSTQFTITAIQGSNLAVPLTTASGIMSATQQAPSTPDSGSGQWSFQYAQTGYARQGVISLYKKDSNNIYALVDTIVSPYPVANENFGSNFAFGNDVIYISAPGYNNSSGRVYKLKYSSVVQAQSAYNPVGSAEATLRVTSTIGILPGMYVLGTGFTSGQTVTSVVNFTTLILSGSPDSTPNGVIEFAVVGWGYDQAEVYTGNITGMNFGYSLAISNDNSTLAISAASSVTTALVAIFKATPTVVLTTTGATGTGTTATLTFAKQTLLPYALGDTITVSGVVPSSFNGAFVVTAVTLNSVSYASHATGPQTQAGTISGNSLTGFGLVQILQGVDYDIQLAISDDGNYIAISDDTTSSTQIKQQGSVAVYNYHTDSGLYFIQQTLVPHQPETNGHFGRKISFMNNFETLVIYSQYGDTFITTTFDKNSTTFDKNSTPFTVRQINSGRIDIYDRYDTSWVFSESLTRSNPVTPAGEFVVGNTYSILSLGTTDFTKVGASVNAIGVTFTATGDGSGTGIAAIITNEGGVADGYGTGFAVGGNHVLIGAPFGIDHGLTSGRVYDYSKMPGTKTWTIIHSEIDKPDVKKIKKAFLYNRTLGTLVTYLDIIDPAQGKIAGPAEEEIKFKAFYDPATYSVGDTTVNVNTGTAWKDDQVGLLWWDLRTAKFLNAYEDNPVYKNTNWNSLATGASIDIYEWVSYNQLPAVWDSLADTPAGITAGISGTSLYGNSCYSVKQTYNTVTQTFKNTYYFWVKNKKFIPNVAGRNLAASDVSTLIANPRGQGYTYLALTGPSSFSLVNAKQYLKHDEVVLSVEYWLGSKTNQNVHSHWKLVSEDPTTYIPDVIEQKWIDSLCGNDSVGRPVPDPALPPKLRYGIENRPRQGMFVNRFEALKEFVEQANQILLANQIVENSDLKNLESYDPAPAITTGLYDIAFDNYAELIYASVGNYTTPSINPTISDGRITGITINTDSTGNPLSGKGYLVAPYITVNGTGTGAVVNAIINTKGQITGAKVISSGQGYDSTTTLTIRNYSALIRSDVNANGNWSIYAWIPPVTSVGKTTVGYWSLVLTQAYDVRNYWSYADWYATGYSQFTAADFSVATLADLNSISPIIGQTVKVRTTNTGGWELLYKYADSTSIDWTQSYHVVGLQNGTIQLDASLYNLSNTQLGFDNNIYDSQSFDLYASTELRIILSSLKNDIFKGELNGSYLDLFFGSVHYIHSEQLYVDWIFKTSFVRAQHNVGGLDQPVTYKPDNLANFEDYVNEVKPYKTTVREYISNYDSIDPAQLPITDFDLPSIYENNKRTLIQVYSQNDKIIAQDPAIETYPWKFWLDNAGFTITELKLTSGGSGYVTEPQVIFTSNSGSGATARAFISNEKVNRIVLLTPGTGYLSAPTITIKGGILPTGTPATAVAIIGKSLVRSNYVGIKFDRVDQTYVITQLEKTETFTGTGSRLQFVLQWGPDNTIGKSSVTLNGILALRDTYTLAIVSSTVKGYTTYSGTITFTTAPKKGVSIVVTYNIAESLLSATDRIQYYYTPSAGEPGKDLAQLMTGIDYGGVIVNGLGFEISQGWDSVPFYSDKWDSYDSTYKDYSVVVNANTNTFTLPYTPDNGIQLNIYRTQVNVDSYVSDGVTKEYVYNTQDIAPYVTLTHTTYSSGVRATFASVASVAGSYVNTITLVSTANITVGMTATGEGFVSGQTVTAILSSTQVQLSVPPDSLPSGIIIFTTNVVASNILYVNSVTGIRVGDVITTTDTSLSLFALNTTVTAVGPNSTLGLSANQVQLSSILYFEIPDSTYLNFVRTLIQPTDVVISNNGKITLTNLTNSGIALGSIISILGKLNPVRLDDPNYNIKPFFAQLVESAAYDAAYNSNYQSILVGLAISNHITSYGYKSSETNYSINNLLETVSNLQGVGTNAEAVLAIDTNTAIVTTIVGGGIVPQPIFTLPYGTPTSIVYNVPNINGSPIGTYVYIPVASISATPVQAGWSVSGLGLTGFATVVAVVLHNGLVAAQINQSIGLQAEYGNYTFISPNYGLYSAATLLNDNIPFIQAELIQYITNNYPSVVYDQTDFQTKIQYIVLSLCYDLTYGGNRESIYSANQYWIYNNSIPFIQPPAYWSGVFGYLNSMAQHIITNTQFTRLQTHFFQYTNSGLANGQIAGTAISNNISTITTIISSAFYPNAPVTNPTAPAQDAGLQTVLSTILSNESTLIPSINATAIVNTFLSDGVSDVGGLTTKTFSIPQPYTLVDGGQANTTIDIEVDDGGSASTVYGILDKVDAGSNASANVFTVSKGDEFVIRQTTSDGSIAPRDQDYDTSLSGGDTTTLNGVYATATGLSADDIIVDGDGLITTTTNVAPEEVVPGQLVDALAIKIFEKPTSGSGVIRTDNYIGDGATTGFKISQQPNSPGAVIVKVGGAIKTVTTDYDVDYRNNNIVFHTAPTSNSEISIFSIGFNGANIIDIDYFVGDGTTSEFVSSATWTTPITTLVYVDGKVASPQIFKTDKTYLYSGAIGFNFGKAPAAGALINFIIVAGTVPTYAITNVETIATNGQFTYNLQNPVGTFLPDESDMIVRVDQSILPAPVNAYFTIGSNRLNYTVDPTKFVPYSIDIRTLYVYAGSNTLTLGTDYIVDLSGVTIKINKTTYNTYKGQTLVVSLTTGEGYTYNALNNQITFNTAYDNTHLVQVISSYQHEFLDSQRTTLSTSTLASLTPNSSFYFYMYNILGGIVQLDRQVLSEYYVWVIKNGTLLSPVIDYKLNPDYQSITLAQNTSITDKLTIITFGSNVYTSGIAYMQFKDMLNRVTYKRLSKSKQTTLAQDLHWNDTVIVVENASNFDLPNPSKNKPGVIEIRGERIEYFSLVGNQLSQLRRGTLGTGIYSVSLAGTLVQDIGPFENIPYSDTQKVTQIVSDGTNLVSLDFVPATINDMEIFVGGYNDGSVWETGAVYPVGAIVNVGSYTYRCLISHISGSTFFSSVTQVTINSDGTTTSIATNIASSSAWKFFIGNRRLKKVGYSVFNINNAPTSPEGDVAFSPDFTIPAVKYYGPTWASGLAVAIGVYVNYENNYYEVTVAGVLGTTGPNHTLGTASNGTASLTFIINGATVILTNLLSFGTQITVVQNSGLAWDNVTSVLYDTGKISDFLRAEPGIWYSEYKQISNVSVGTFDNTLLSFDGTRTTFDQGTTQ